LEAILGHPLLTLFQFKCCFKNTCGNRETVRAPDCFLHSLNVVPESPSTRLIAATKFPGEAWSGEMTAPTFLSAILAATPG